MIGYRFLLPAEEEMTEASAFYETASVGLGSDFLDDVQRVVDALREHPGLGRALGEGLRQLRLPSVSSIRWRQMQSSLSRLRINGEAPVTGKTELNRSLAGECVQLELHKTSTALRDYRCYSRGRSLEMGRAFKSFGISQENPQAHAP